MVRSTVLESGLSISSPMSVYEMFALDDDGPIFFSKFKERIIKEHGIEGPGFNFNNDTCIFDFYAVFTDSRDLI